MELVVKAFFSYYIVPSRIVPIVLDPAQVCTQDLNTYFLLVVVLLFVFYTNPQVKPLRFKKLVM